MMLMKLKDLCKTLSFFHIFFVKNNTHLVNDNRSIMFNTSHTNYDIYIFNIYNTERRCC